MQDLHTFLHAYEATHPHLVVHVQQEVNARWQASAIALKAQKELKEAPILIFHRVRGDDGRLSPFPLVLNLFVSRQRLAFAAGSSFERVAQDLYGRRAARIRPVVVDRGVAPVKQVVHMGDAVDLRELPAIVHAARHRSQCLGLPGSVLPCTCQACASLAARVSRRRSHHWERAAPCR